MGLFSRKPKLTVPESVELINANDAANLRDYVVLDVETTGLDPVANRIIEVAAIRVQEGRETGRYQTFVNPKVKVPKEITNLTGIKNADIKNGKPYEEMAQDVSDFIGDLPIVAHNAPFDVKFVAAAMSLIGREYSTPAVDTVGLAKLAHPNLVNYKLNTLIRHLSLTDHEQTHRAMDDVLCTKKLFDNCRRIIYANNSVHAQKKTVDKALESVESAKTAVDVFLAYGNAEATLSEAMAMDPDSTEIVFGDVGKFLTKNYIIIQFRARQIMPFNISLLSQPPCIPSPSRFRHITYIYFAREIYVQCSIYLHLNITQNYNKNIKTFSTKNLSHNDIIVF